MDRREVRVDEALWAGGSQETGVGRGRSDRSGGLCGVGGGGGRVGAPSGWSSVGVEGLVVGTGKGRAGHVCSTGSVLVVMHGRG